MNWVEVISKLKTQSQGSVLMTGMYTRGSLNREETTVIHLESSEE